MTWSSAAIDPGAHFGQEKIRPLNGWLLEDVINHYVETYNYLPVQVRAIFEKKIAAGEIGLTEENRLLLF